MAKQKKPKFIEPTITVNDEKHILEEIFEGDPSEMPTLKSVGYAQLKGSPYWVSYVLTTKGTKVLKIEIDEPNLRGIAEETSKINFVNELMNQGIV